MTTHEQVADREQRFDWPLCYEAEDFVLKQLEAFTQRNHFARDLAERMVRETGTLLLDWVDHIAVSKDMLPTLTKLGYCEDPLAESFRTHTVFWHPEAMLPRVVID